MARYNRVKLRHTLKKLFSAAPGTMDAENAPAYTLEMLEILSVLTGSKPVMLHYHNLDEPSWTSGLLRTAGESGLRIIAGPHWDARPDALTGHGRLVPDAFAQLMQSGRQTGLAYYICRSRSVCEELEHIMTDADFTVAQESRLLNYPECCVRAYYFHLEHLYRFSFELLKKATDGDDEEAMRRAGNGEIAEPQTDEEIEQLRRLMRIAPLPYTSISACSSCATGDPETPGMRISEEARQLALAMGEQFAAVISRPF